MEDEASLRSDAIHSHHIASTNANYGTSRSVFEIGIGCESAAMAVASDEFKPDMAAAFVAQGKSGSADDGDEMRKTVLIVRNAIETISGSWLSRLEYLRHKDAHHSAKLDLNQHRGGPHARSSFSETTRC